MIFFLAPVIFLSLGYFLGRKHGERIAIDTMIDPDLGPLVAKMITRQIKKEELQTEINKLSRHRGH